MFMESAMTNSNGVAVDGERDCVRANHLKREKLIIDTDPGIGQFSVSICLIFFFQVLCISVPIACLVARKFEF